MEQAPQHDTPQLYEARKKLYPKRGKGNFRRFKWLVMWLTLGVYYVTPWIRWDRGPYAPNQAVLVDMVEKRFFFFNIEIWPQEFFFVAGMLVMAGIGLFLVTSVLGRAWCGYTCPQTVWVDLFLVVERFFEGDRNARMKLDKADWSFDKIRKKLSKHIVWLLIAVATGGAWVFYFFDAPILLKDLLIGDAPMVAYGTIIVLTATTYVFGGLMREQVCTYMCPWPRVQAAMLDKNSLTVTYNDWRGEPRSRHRKKIEDQSTVGDCVDCDACVVVCPMGIDIRDGQQLACITCALCIDACNSIMDKLGKPRGLISYTTEADYAANMQASGAVNTGDGWDMSKLKPKALYDAAMEKLNDKARMPGWHTFLRMRTIIYVVVYAAFGLALLGVLYTRDRLDVRVAHDRNPQFVQLADGAVRNRYEVKVLNMLPEPRIFTISLDGLPQGRMAVPLMDTGWVETLTVHADPDRTETIDVFIKVEESDLAQAPASFDVKVTEVGGEGEEYSVGAQFYKPD